jgi:site-specific DNA recombinase
MRVALYARSSSAKQKLKERSVPDQVAAVEAYCKEHRHVVVERYADDGISGRSTKRPGFQRMLKAATSKKPPFGAIVTYDVSRWGRSKADAAEKVRVRENGVAVIHIGEGIVEEGTGEDIFEMQSREFSTKLSRDVKRGMYSAVERGGKGVGGPQPFGYRTDRSFDGGRVILKTVLDPDAAPLAKLAFEKYAFGESIRDIALWLRKVTTGRKWAFASVSKMLRNPRYCGTAVIGRRKIRTKTSTGEKTSEKVPKSEWTLRENAFPAIVDQSLFDRVQALLARNKAHPVKGASPRNLIAGGIGRCAGCNGSAYFHVLPESQGGHAHYVCRARVLEKSGNPACKGSMRKTIFDENLTAWIALLIANTDTMRAAVRQYNERLAEAGSAPEIVAVEHSLDDARKRERKFAEALGYAPDMKIVVEQLRKASAEKEALEEELSRLRALHAIDTQPLDESQLTKDIKTLQGALRKADAETVQRLVPKLISRVVFTFRPKPPSLKKFFAVLASKTASKEEKRAAAEVIDTELWQATRKETTAQFAPRWSAWKLDGMSVELINLDALLAVGGIVAGAAN